jgi:hypothetical protein
MDKKNYTQPLNIEDVCPDVLRRYIEMRRLIDFEIETIQGITRGLIPLKDSDENISKMDSAVVGKISEVIERHATNAWSTLDEFIPISSAQIKLVDLHKLGRKNKDFC